MKIYTIKIDHKTDHGKQAKQFHEEKWIRLEDFREALEEAYEDGFTAAGWAGSVVFSAYVYVDRVIANMEAQSE